MVFEVLKRSERSHRAWWRDDCAAWCISSAPASYALKKPMKMGENGELVDGTSISSFKIAFTVVEEIAVGFKCKGATTTVGIKSREPSPHGTTSIKVRI